LGGGPKPYKTPILGGYHIREHEMKLFSKTNQFFIATFVVAIAAMGCGGSGEGGGPSLSGSALKTEIAKSVQGGFVTQTTGNAQSKAKTPPPTTARAEDPAPYFDDAYQVWGKPITPTATEAGTVSGADFFVDEALTQPAGELRKTTLLAGGNLTFKVTVNVTAGPNAGLQNQITTSYIGGVFQWTYSGKNPDGSSYDAQGNYNGETVAYRFTETDTAGVTREYVAQYNADGTSVISSDSPRGFRYTLNFAADQSGTGSVTGNDALLPAQITWDTAGSGKITFADQSEVPFTNFEFNQF